MKMIDIAARTTVTARQENWLETVRSRVASPRFGVVSIGVRDPVVGQIERAENGRLDKPPTGNPEA